MTFNKGSGLGDIGKKNKSNQLDITTKGDVISALGKTQTGNKEVIDNQFKSKDILKNALNAHNTDNLFNTSAPDAPEDYFGNEPSSS